MDDGDLLARLVACYSPSGAEAAAVREFGRIARALGYRYRVDAAGNGRAERGRGRPHVLFLGHIDTVEGSWPVRRRRGRLHGRGTVDAKGALASALLAGRGFAGPGTFQVVAAVGEETDSRGARYLQQALARPDVVIAGEPSGWDGVTIGYKGDLRLAASFAHPRTHWSGPAPTAAELALAWTERFRAAVVSPGAASPFRSTTFKVVGLAADPSADPERAAVTLDLRFPPGRSTAELLAAAPAEPGPPRLKLLSRIEPFEVSRTAPVVRALCDGIRAEGGRPTLWRKSGTSDLNLVAGAWGVTGVAYGPGDARLDHTRRESLALGELRRSASVLRRALERLVADPTLRRPGRGPSRSPRVGAR